jgi:hypothetical protein
VAGNDNQFLDFNTLYYHCGNKTSSLSEVISCIEPALDLPPRKQYAGAKEERSIIRAKLYRVRELSRVKVSVKVHDIVDLVTFKETLFSSV